LATSAWVAGKRAARIGLALVVAISASGCGDGGGAAAAGAAGGAGGATVGDPATNAGGATGAAGDSFPEILVSAPDLPNLEFVDQAGEPVFLEELRGKPTLLTFIYVNCPMPEMCPATTLRFQEVQRALDEQMRDRVRLVSVSFDPADTPEVLAEYAELWEVDPQVWTMLTGPEESVQALGAAYGFWFEPQEGGTFRHAMISVILLPDGSVHRVLLGSVWDGAEVADNLARLAAARGEPAPH
jgi:protein SCO1/2